MRIALAIFLSCVLLSGCARLGGDGAQWSHNSVLQLSEDMVVGQSFAVASPELVGVDLLVATYTEAPDPVGELRVRLSDARTGARLAVAATPGSALEDLSWTPVRFHPPVPAAGPLLLEVTWSGSSPVALLANTPRADPDDGEVMDNDPYPYGQLLVDGIPAVGDLAFRVVGSNGPEVLPATAAGLARGALTGVAQQPWFAVLWFALLAGCGALCAFGVTDLRRHRARESVSQRGSDEEERHGREGAAR